MGETRTHVTAVANQKGGVGKTTTIINLAACLADMGRTVLVVDLDPQANTTSGFGLPAQEGASLYRVMLGEGHVADAIQATRIEGLNIIPAELDLAGAEVDIARTDGYLHCLQKVVTPIIEAGVFDFILFDCPPALGILTMNALAAAHSVVVPMQCEYYALEGLSVITRIINRLRDSGANPRIALEGILMTMFDGRTNLSNQVVQEVQQHFPDLVYKTVIPRNVRLSEAPSHGQPITQYDPHSTGAIAYRAFAEEFAGRAATDDAAGRPAAERISASVSDVSASPPPPPSEPPTSDPPVESR